MVEKKLMVYEIGAIASVLTIDLSHYRALRFDSVEEPLNNNDKSIHGGAEEETKLSYLM